VKIFLLNRAIVQLIGLMMVLYPKDLSASVWCFDFSRFFRAKKVDHVDIPLGLKQAVDYLKTASELPFPKDKSNKNAYYALVGELERSSMWLSIDNNRIELAGRIASNHHFHLIAQTIIREIQELSNMNISKAGLVSAALDMMKSLPPERNIDVTAGVLQSALASNDESFIGPVASFIKIFPANAEDHFLKIGVDKPDHFSRWGSASSKASFFRRVSFASKVLNTTNLDIYKYFIKLIQMEGTAIGKEIDQLVAQYSRFRSFGELNPSHELARKNAVRDIHLKIINLLDNWNPS
jgi:hypothetical protein